MSIMQFKVYAVPTSDLSMASWYDDDTTPPSAMPSYAEVGIALSNSNTKLNWYISNNGKLLKGHIEYTGSPQYVEESGIVLAETVYNAYYNLKGLSLKSINVTKLEAEKSVQEYTW